LTCLRVVQKQAKILEVTCRAIGLDFFELRSAIPNFPNHHSSTEFDPGRGACQRMLQALHVRFPAAEIEIKVVLPIPLDSRLRRARLL
jgi:hypothetical protein